MKFVPLKSLAGIAIAFTLLSGAIQVQAQSAASTKIALDAFYPDQLEQLINKKINAFRKSKGIDSLKYNDLLNAAGKDQAKFMVAEETVTSEQGSKKKRTPGKRVEYYGGADFAEECVGSQSAGKGKESFTYDEVATLIVDKWIKGKTQILILSNSTYIYIGTGVELDPASKKIYVSTVFGSFNTFNIGSQKRKDMKVPFTIKKYKLKKPLDAKECKDCDKFNDWEALHKGLYVKDGKIYLRYDDLKAIEKLLKDPKDGLAVDIIQKDQYPCAPYNIYDPKKVNKGVMTKRKWQSKIFKKNLLSEENLKKAANNEKKDSKGKGKAKTSGKKSKKKKGLEIELGTFPAEITGDYELNLLVIQDKRVCKTVTRQYTEDGGLKSVTPLEMLPDTVSRGQIKYAPKAEEKNLSFTIPYDKAQFEYKPSDIKPFIDKLTQPDYIVKSITITAYSSIEGDSARNSDLQKKRAEGIVKALQKVQKDSIIQQIKTDDAWELFKKDVQGTEYANLALLTKKQVKKAIDDTGLEKDMEGILSKERICQIDLTISYDITGDKEEPYVMANMKKAIDDGDGAQALEIQRFMIAKVLDDQYNPENVINMKVPFEGKYASLFINKIWLESYLKKDTLSADIQQAFIELAKLSPKNEFCTYNSLFSYVKDPAFDEKAIDSIQAKIQDLYLTKLPKDRIDAVNMEYQFKVIDNLDNKEGAEPIVKKSIDVIKNVFKLEGSSWQNALKLAYIFAHNKDYDFAMKLLEPFIKSPDADENLVFLYISLMSHYPEKVNSSAFVNITRRARKLSPVRYCKLFGAPYLSFQILENPYVKEDYCKYCNTGK